MKVEAQSLTSPSYVPTRFIFGEGASQTLPDYLREVAHEFSARRPLFVCGHRSAAKSWLENLLRVAGSGSPLIIEKRDEYLTIEGVSAMLREAQIGRVDVVIGIGGGSVMDAAKSIALLVDKAVDLPAALAGVDIDGESLPLIVLPTTAGTGAEATSFATIWDMKRHRKHSLTHLKNYPDIAIIDPLLHASVPLGTKISCALDALCQAIEGCWSRRATEESIAFGIEAITLVLDGLERLRVAPNDPSLLCSLSKGSLYSGLAIALGRTTIPHAISYPLTAWYGIPHGRACALTIGAMLDFNASITPVDCLDRRGPAYVARTIDRICAALRVANASEGRARLDNLLILLGQKTFAQMNEIDIDLLLDEVMSYDRFDNNPRLMRSADLRTVLQELQAGNSRAKSSAPH